MATTSNDTSGTIISAHFVYKITFGNSITASNSQIKELTLEQGVSTTFQDKESNETYHVTLHGVKVNKPGIHLACIIYDKEGGAAGTYVPCYERAPLRKRHAAA